jgi:hypothetical protein
LPTVRPANLLQEAQALLRIGTDETAQLAALPRPAGAARSTIESLLASSRHQVELVRQLIQAVKRGDSAAATRLDRTSNRLNARYNAIARRLGADVCAENPSPGG